MIGSSQLVGIWTGEEGRLAFNADHPLKVTALRLDSGTRFLTQCPFDWSGSGTWQFLSPQGVSGLTLTQYRRGSVVAVILPVCALDVTTWYDGHGPDPVSLCSYGEADDPCIGPLFYKEVANP